MPVYRWFLWVTLCLVLMNSGMSLAVPMATPVKVLKTHALTLLEAPRYPRGFKHFDYVNPDAPKGGLLSMTVSGEFNSFNPFINQGNPAWTIEIIYDSLLEYSADEPYSAYGLEADSIEVPEDYSWVAFNLNPQARFHVGHPVTADNLVFTLNTLLEKGQPHYKLTYGEIDSVAATSPTRVLYTFKHSDQRKLPFLIGQLPVLPKHFWERPEHIFTRGSFDIPLGSSAYRMKSFKPGHRVIYERINDYWAKKHPVKLGRHNFDTLIYDNYRDINVAFEAFKKGDYNLRWEMVSRIWETGYDFPAVQRGRCDQGKN